MGGSEKLPFLKQMRKGYAFARKSVLGMTNFQIDAWAMIACSDGSKLIASGKRCAKEAKKHDYFAPLTQSSP